MGIGSPIGHREYRQNVMVLNVRMVESLLFIAIVLISGANISTLVGRGFGINLGSLGEGFGWLRFGCPEARQEA